MLIIIFVLKLQLSWSDISLKKKFPDLYSHHKSLGNLKVAVLITCVMIGFYEDRKLEYHLYSR
jgi:hypothetical protein